MAGAEGTVDLEAVSVVQEGAPQGEEDFLRREEREVRGGSRRTYYAFPRCTFGSIARS